jgi:hypothetical protein
MQKHKIINMRTTMDLPDDLGIEIKIVAAQENRTLKEVISELLRAGLKSRQQVQARSNNLPPVYRPRVRFDRTTLQEILNGESKEVEQ